MTQDIGKNHPASNEIDFGGMLRLLFLERKFIFLSVLVSTSIAIGIAFTSTPIYQADVLLSPAGDAGKDRLGNLAGLASQFGGLTSLAGISLGQGSTKAVSIATLQSRILTESYIRDEDLLPILFPGQWDDKSRQWKESDPKKIPTLWDGNKLFDKTIRKVSENKQTGLVTLSIRWKDPQLAAKWANDLVSRANLHLQKIAIDESNRNISYLQQQLKATGIVEIQQAVSTLLGSEIKTVMLAQGNDEYAFHVIDPAVFPQEKSSPKRSLIALVGFFLGLSGASLFVLVRSAIRKNKLRIQG